MSDHAWAQENLVGFLAGGLTGDERGRLERHAAGCAACAKALAEWGAVDKGLDDLFAEVRPEAGWENRVIQSLRAAPSPRRSRWLVVGRYAAALAALVFLGVLGAVVHGLAVRGNLPFPGTKQGSDGFKFGVDMVGGTMLVHEDKAKLLFVFDSSDSMKLPPTNGTLQYHLLPYLEQVEGKSSKKEKNQENELTFYPPALALIVRAPSRVHTSITGGIIGGKQTQTLAESGRDKVNMNGSMGVDQTLANALKERINPDELFNIRIRPTETPPSNKSPGYYNPVVVAKLGPEKEKQPGSKSSQEAKQKEDGKQKQPPGNDQKKPDDPVPAPGQRKIIRTGEVEFEIESFDAAEAAINRLVKATQTGLVITVNKEKLPNGKVRGAVVVRVPPESLDQFMLDLRRDLGKAGELKSQRLGSQDVTKHYTDVESRLRAARAMEERLLAIIKGAKGEIKDLIAAERELGVWRTKIEEMEGEIRFYNNLVALSTLTINLYEKEIQAPSALVVTERIEMRIEVEDVVEAQETALEAVDKAKGRVTRSELKLSPDGQREAHLHFEAAPAPAGELRKSLPKLGHVAHHEVVRLQQAEGGTGRPADLKPRTSDVQFQIVLYNVANIQPRETLTLHIVTRDVPSGFHALKKAVAAVNGKVLDGKLHEKDKLHITAHLDFDIRTKDQNAIDKVLKEVGPVLTRSAAQAQPKAGEIVTDRKVGYRLMLLNVASIQPRETVSLSIAVKDVDRALADLVELVRGRDGVDAAAQLKQEPSGQVVGVVLADVPLSAKDDLVRKIKAAGAVRLQHVERNPHVPDGDLATAHIEVKLSSAGPIVPRDEGLWPQIRTSLFYSFKLLSWSLMFIILGLSVALPWALILWGGYKVVGRWRKKAQAAPSAA